MSISSAKVDVRLARVVGVRLGAERRDLVDALAALGADRAEPLALRPDRVGEAVEQALISGGRASVVKSRSWSSPVAPSSNSRTLPPTRYKRCPRAREPLGERGDLVQHRSEPVRDHGPPRLTMDARRTLWRCTRRIARAGTAEGSASDEADAARGESASDEANPTRRRRADDEPATRSAGPRRLG